MRILESTAEAKKVSRLLRSREPFWEAELPHILRSADHPILASAFANSLLCHLALPIIVLVIGGRRVGCVLAANALYAMFLVRGDLAPNREPAIKSEVGN